MRRIAAIALLCLGCGLDEAGQGVVDGSAEAGDVAVDVVKDVTPFVCSDAGPASCNDAVPFRSPALFSADAGAPCPPGYDTHDLVYAVPSADHCDCSCNDGGAAACDTTKANIHFGFGSCGTAGSIALAGSCTAVNEGTAPGESLQVDQPAVTGGCTGGTSTPPPLTTTKVRLCTPQCASDESVCTGTTGLSACVAVIGNVQSCPPTSYTKGPFYIGEGPQATCDTCSCTATGDCSGSTLHLYGNASCGGGDQSFPMDNTCHTLTGGQIGLFGSAAVKPVIKGPVACQIDKGLSHTTYGGNDFTVCCQ